MADTTASGRERIQRGLVDLNKRVLTALRSGDADTMLTMPVQHSGFAGLTPHKHCLLVTYRRDGTPVVQPVWPGHDGDRLYVWTEHQAYKAKRLRRNPEALVAPCSFRGHPLGPPIAARGRILVDTAERRHAEQVIRDSWGWKRRTFERLSRPLTEVVYLELVPHPGARG
jgi:PPOX class probable F420-dependent enzyme